METEHNLSIFAIRCIDSMNLMIVYILNSKTVFEPVFEHGGLRPDTERHVVTPLS